MRKEYFKPSQSASFPCSTGSIAAPRKPIVNKPDASAVFLPNPSIEMAYKVGKKIEINKPSKVIETTATMPVVVIMISSKTMAAITENTSVNAGFILF